MFPYIVLVYDGALLLGFLARRLRAAPRPADRLIPAAILVLVAALGASVAQTTTPFDPYLATLEGIGVALALVGSTTAASYLLGARRASRSPTHMPARPWLLPVAILAALAFGYAVGEGTPHSPTATGAIEEVALVVMLFLIGWTIRWVWPSLRQVVRPLVAASLGAVATAALVVVVTGTSVGDALALVVPFGWYSLAGPYVATQISPAFGFVAFLANFLRENFTMTGAPVIGRVAGAEGLTASGGATAMDTTLYFVEAYGDPDWATTALACGLILTLAAPLLLALVLI